VITYKCGAPYGELLQHYIGLNILEPLDLLLAGKSLEELDWIWKRKL
jgi:hypothetical protein